MTQITPTHLHDVALPYLAPQKHKRGGKLLEKPVGEAAPDLVRVLLLDDVPSLAKEDGLDVGRGRFR